MLLRLCGFPKGLCESEKGNNCMDSTTVSLLGGCIATIIPLLFVIIIVKDTNSRRILLYFCWGSFAGLLAYGINNLFGAAPEQMERVTTTIAPIVEEICKGLPLIFFLRKEKFVRLNTLIVYCAFASGIGFSIQESIYYFSQSSGVAGDIITLSVRTLTTALMHGMSTAVLGVGLMLLQKQRHIFLPVVSGLFALSTAIHALFNLLLPTNFALIAILMPIGLYFAGLLFLGGVRKEKG